MLIQAPGQRDYYRNLFRDLCMRHSRISWLSDLRHIIGMSLALTEA